MKDFLYLVVRIIAKIHNYLMGLNDAYEYNFSDKELHFLVIGILGMAMLFVVYPLFKVLSRNHVMVIAWIYVFPQPDGCGTPAHGRSLRLPP